MQLLVGNLGSNPRALLAQEYSVIPAVATAFLELLGRVILVWVVLVSVHAPDVVLVVHIAGILFGLVVGTLAVVGVHA